MLNLQKTRSDYTATVQRWTVALREIKIFLTICTSAIPQQIAMKQKYIKKAKVGIPI